MYSKIVEYLEEKNANKRNSTSRFEFDFIKYS